MRLAIIPARGGSKRIPQKNIKEFCGKPIIAYSIEAALNSKVFDKVIVSTDSYEVGNIARQFGAEVPFWRPAELSDDYTVTAPVISHAIDFYEKQGHEVEFACCIYATAPFVTAEDLKNSHQIIYSSPEVMFVYSASTFSFPIQRAFYINDDEEVQMFWPENYLTRSQDLKEAYQDAGQFYWGRPEGWKKELVFFAPHSRVYKLPRNRVQDIDTIEDWEFAEKLYKLNQQQEGQP